MCPCHFPGRFVQHRPIKDSTAIQPLLGFLVLAAIAALLLWLSLMPVVGEGNLLLPLLADGLLEGALSNAAEVVAAVLAIAVTVVAIVVELAANRYSHLITRLFVREPANFVVLGLFVVTTLQCLWFGPWLGRSEPGVAWLGALVTMSLVSVSLLSLLPYVYYVFNFLSPISIIARIHDDARRAISRAIRDPDAREAVRRAVDELQDVARSALVRGDREIAMASVDSLAELVRELAARRHRLPEHWDVIDGAVARDPDFVALAAENLEEIEARGIWLETKIFRRLASLVGQSTGHSRDVANLVAMHTQGIAVDVGMERAEIMTLCIRAFNSYLRTTLNAHDMRTAYYIQNQYRQVAERLLAADDPRGVDEIAGHLAYYGQLAYRAGLPFLLETAAHDVSELIRAALIQDARDETLVDRLLERLLGMDQEIREEEKEESLLGIRRAQIKMGALLIHLGEMDRARRIAADLAHERRERLERLREGLLTDERPQYWELIDRGTNFAYLAPELRPHLAVLYGWIG